MPSGVSTSTSRRPIDDPGYDGFGEGKRGWSITAGEHHLDGANALAYARSRKSAGESDFTRAGRQQQIIVALKDAATEGGSVFWELPGLIGAVGDSIRTDLPIDRLPQLAAAIDEMGKGGITRAVIRHPLVRSVDTRYGSSLQPDIPAIRAVAAGLFPPPGGTRRGLAEPEAVTVGRPAMRASGRLLVVVVALVAVACAPCGLVPSTRDAADTAAGDAQSGGGPRVGSPADPSRARPLPVPDGARPDDGYDHVTDRGDDAGHARRMGGGGDADRQGRGQRDGLDRRLRADLDRRLRVHAGPTGRGSRSPGCSTTRSG